MSDDARSSIDEQALGWFVRLRDEPVGDAERAAFAEWRLADPSHARAFEELTAIWSDLDAILARVDDPTALPLQNERRATLATRVHRRALVVSFGALALMFGAYEAFAPPGGVPALLADARTAPGQMRDLTLPDGTRVRLAGASALSYDVSANDRRVTLIAGRAFFDVRHERTRPFRVLAGSAEIRDIGTAFEVSAGDNRASVAVAQGEVEIALAGGTAATLHVGQSVAFGTSLGRIKSIPPADVASWRGNRMTFDNARLKDVLAELQSYGAGRIVLLDSSLGEKRLTGAFDTRRPRQALGAIAAIAGAHVTRFGPISFVRRRRNV